MVQRTSPLLILFLIFLCILFPGYGVEDNSDVYNELFQIENTWMSENNLTGCTEYGEAISYAENYPLYAFDLLVDCYTENVSKHFLDLSDKFDTLVAGSMLLDEAESEYSQLKEEMDSFHPETLPAHEWSSLAIKNIENADTYIKGAEDNLSKDNSYGVMTSLIQAFTSLHKARAFISMSKERNNVTSQSMPYSAIAYKWISTVKNMLKEFEEFGQFKDVKSLINSAEKHYDEGYYYLALMESAQAKALMDYYLNRPDINNGEEAIRIAETYFNYTSTFMSEIYESNLVDAPFAEIYFELAELHIKDAKKQDRDSAKITIATLSIKESMIAKEQAIAAMFLSKTDGLSLENPQSTDQNVSNSFNQYVLAGLILLVIVVALVIVKKLRK